MGLDETLPSMAKIVQEFISDRKNPKKYIFSMPKRRIQDTRFPCERNYAGILAIGRRNSYTPSGWLVIRNVLSREKQ